MLFWHQLVRVNRVLGEFRSHFVGKASPVHFFWGSMDLAWSVASAGDPDAVLSEFLDITYVAAAELGGWDRAALEADPHRWDHQRQ